MPTEKQGHHHHTWGAGWGLPELQPPSCYKHRRLPSDRHPHGQLQRWSMDGGMQLRPWKTENALYTGTFKGTKQNTGDPHFLQDPYLQIHIPPKLYL